jgi:hypothetical protein
MKARQLIENAPYDPGQVRALGKAFDDAWAEIAPSIDNRPDAIEEARLDLAHLILNLARRGNFGPQQLAGTAVLIMASYL